MNRRNLLVGGGAVILASSGAALFQRQLMGTLDDYRSAQNRLRAALATRPRLSGFIRYATLAPSGHNTQPWKFRPSANELAILPDFNRRTPVVDPDDHHLFVSLGCMAETLDMVARRYCQGGELVPDSAQGSAWVYRFGRDSAGTDPLFDAIPLRQSTRAVFNGLRADTNTLARLVERTDARTVDLALITEKPDISRFADLIAEGNSIQMGDPAFIRELRDWLRFNAHDAIASGDGLFSASSGNPQLPSWLGPRLFDLTFRSETENQKYREQVQSAAGLAVFFAKRPDKHGWFDVGRACQRFALAATTLGMKVSFLNQPVEVPALRERCASLAGEPQRRPDVLMRFGFGDALPYSFRRPVAQVIV